MAEHTSTRTVSLLLDDDQKPAERISSLMPLVYDQLRAVAQRAMGLERNEHTLQATAIVHEAYIRLVGDRQIPWANRAHFYSAAAEAMRRVLLDHARSKARKKRGGGFKKVPLNDILDLSQADYEIILAVDDGICRLEAEHLQACHVVRLRFFAGLSVEDTASALSISPRQVNRLWTFARAWLYRYLENQESD